MGLQVFSEHPKYGDCLPSLTLCRAIKGLHVELNADDTLNGYINHAPLANKGVYEVVPELSKPNEAEAEAKAMTEEKYWQQRYRFFSKFDEGVQLDSGLKPNFLPP